MDDKYSINVLNHFALLTGSGETIVDDFKQKLDKEKLKKGRKIDNRKKRTDAEVHSQVTDTIEVTVEPEKYKEIDIRKETISKLDHSQHEFNNHNDEDIRKREYARNQRAPRQRKGDNFRPKHQGELRRPYSENQQHNGGKTGEWGGTFEKKLLFDKNEGKSHNDIHDKEITFHRYRFSGGRGFRSRRGGSDGSYGNDRPPRYLNRDSKPRFDDKCELGETNPFVDMKHVSFSENQSSMTETSPITGNEYRNERKLHGVDGRGREFRGTGRGFRGGRYFNRHSGFDRANVQIHEKRNGEGKLDLGHKNEELEEVSMAKKEEKTWADQVEEEEEQKKDVEPMTMTLDEYKKSARPLDNKSNLNLRQAGEGENQNWNEGIVLKKPDECEDDEHQKSYRRKTPKNRVDIDINFVEESNKNLAGARRGRGRRGNYVARGNRKSDNTPHFGLGEEDFPQLGA